MLPVQYVTCILNWANVYVILAVEFPSRAMVSPDAADAESQHAAPAVERVKTMPSISMLGRLELPSSVELSSRM